MSFVPQGGKSLVLSGTGLGVVENGQKGGTKGKVDPLRNFKSRHPQLQHKAIFPTSSLSRISTSLPHSFVLCHHFLLFVSKSCSISPRLYSLPQSSFTAPSSSHTFPLVVLLDPLHFVSSLYRFFPSLDFSESVDI